MKSHAEALSEFIAEVDTPITIGIQGDWGIGKTSLLNLIKERLEAITRSKRPIQLYTITIETWQYSQLGEEKELTLAVLRAIKREVINQISDLQKKREMTERNKKLFRKLSRAVGVTASSILKEKLGIDTEKLHEAMSEEGGSAQEGEDDDALLLEELKKEFELAVREVTSAANAKIVIMLDDLDRLRPVKALELLEAVKNFMDVESVVFVLAIDYSVIKQGVKDKFGADANEFYGKSFFDKIIQVPYNMPVSAYQIDRYVMHLMGWQLDPKNPSAYIRAPHYSEHSFLAGTGKQYIPVEDAEYFPQVLRLASGNNPRAIKRILNYANLLRHIYRQNKYVDSARKQKAKVWSLREAKIVLAIAAIHLSWPEVLYHFARKPTPSVLESLKNPEYLVKLPDLQPLFKKSADGGRTAARISGVIDLLMSTIDENSDGTITPSEFSPVWEVLTKANLTNVRLSSPENDLREFLELAIERSNCTSELMKIHEAFSESRWNNPVLLRFLEAGRYTRHIEWDKKIIGSLVTKRSSPIEMYLIGEAIGWPDAEEGWEVPGEIHEFVFPFPYPHQGLGDYKVDLNKIRHIQISDQIELFNKLYAEINKGKP